jgi:hypothetical protein
MRLAAARAHWREFALPSDPADAVIPLLDQFAKLAESVGLTPTA